MKLYVVVGGWDYEGDHVDSLRLFQNEVDADQYKEDLEKHKNETGLNEDVVPYDYAVKLLQEVL